MGKLQKTSNEHKTGIFDAMLNKHVPLNQREPEMKQPRKEAERDRSWETLSDSPKLAHSTPDEVDLVRSGRSVRSARCAPEGITDMGGSGKFIGSSRNSIADKAFLDHIAKSATSKEATAEERRASKAMRDLKQQEFRSGQNQKIGEADAAYLSRKGSSIASPGGQIANRYMPGVGKMSIFDNSDFERVQPTAGEKMEKREVKKDNSWQQAKKAHTSKDVVNKVFDELSGNAQDNGYKSVHKDSVDRLFDAIVNGMNKKK
jgi:hypothetical protein